MTKKPNSSKVGALKSDKIVIFEQSHKLWTTSADIAEKFGKRHTDVTRAIRNLECPYDFLIRNFAVTYLLRRGGGTYKAYNISSDGFAFLAMGFTGKEAAAWKVKYIDAFNFIIVENERLRKQIARHKADNVWIALRDFNKERNKDFNEAIADFQKYAEECGSQNAKRYYMLFNDMVNHNLFIFPKGLKNIPDRLEKFQLSFRDSTTKVVIDIIRAGIEKSVHYKELFLLCKSKVIEVTKVLGVTPVPVIEDAQYKLLG